MKTYYFYYVLNLKIMEMEGPLRLPVASSRVPDVFSPGREVYRPACIHNPEPERIVTHKFSYLLPFFSPSPSFVCSLFSGYQPTTTTTTRFQLCKLLAHMFFNLFSYDLEPYAQHIDDEQLGLGLLFVHPSESEFEHITYIHRSTL